MPSKKQKFNSKFPPARIKRIMQTDEDVGKVATPVPVIISRAVELFLDSFLAKAGEGARSSMAKTLVPNHIRVAKIFRSHLPEKLRKLLVPHHTAPCHRPTIARKIEENRLARKIVMRMEHLERIKNIILTRRVTIVSSEGTSQRTSSRSSVRSEPATQSAPDVGNAN
ncbi:unnamed protein product [Cyprideis torosa]|uniref:Uncharacterized protein n=1 Tax=Cyprideis torosa TaxID=163714 RepID=A0A7R8WIX7_9CRUS|nr:unnamed protein product [Cyprideis torosa]CAG0895306.1 unnamed protein product [Cyprideis torosa]